MKINRNTFIANKPYIFKEEIDFSDKTFSYPLKKIDSCFVEAIATDYEDLLRITFKIKAHVTAICAYSLEDVPLDLSIEDEIEITDQESEQEDFFYEPNPIILLDQYVLGLIIAEMPTKVVKKGKTLPKNGPGYRVLSEEDFIKEKETKVDPRWKKLDEIDLD